MNEANQTKSLNAHEYPFKIYAEIVGCDISEMCHDVSNYQEVDACFNNLTCVFALFFFKFRFIPTFLTIIY